MRKSILLSFFIVLLPVAWAVAGAANSQPKPVREASLRLPNQGPPPIVATGLPVPRWVSLKAERVNVRRGPTQDYDLLWTYTQPGRPVEIIAEYDGWRRIRDPEWGAGWVKAAMLDGRRTAMVSGNANTAILAEPKADAGTVAIAPPGFVVKLVSCGGPWCEVLARGYNGFVPRERLVGVYQAETLQ